MASDLQIDNTFVPQKVTLSKISDDGIAYDLWFRPPPIKNPGYANVVNHLITQVKGISFEMTQSEILLAISKLVWCESNKALVGYYISNSLFKKH